jgi:hypothetical protein
MKAIKKTNHSPFLKVNLNILTMPEFSYLHANRESATRVGVFIVLALHLASCPDCVASYSALRTLAYTCNKKEGYLLDMIHHSGIFVYDDEKRIFQCKYICEALHIDTIVDVASSASGSHTVAEAADDSSVATTAGTTVATSTDKTVAKTIADKTAANVSDCRPSIADNREAIADNRSTVVDNRSTIGRNTCANIVYGRTCGREDIDKDIDKNKYSPSTTSNKKTSVVDDVGGDDSSFEKKVFKDKEWLRAAAQATGLQIDTDEKLLVTCARWFGIQLKAKNKSLKNVADGQSYFVYLMQKGHRTRENFEVYLVQQERDGDVTHTMAELHNQSEYERVVNGHRFGFRGEPVEKNAPPQWNQDTMWSWIRHEWICCLDWDKKIEMAAFRKAMGKRKA